MKSLPNLDDYVFVRSLLMYGHVKEIHVDTESDLGARIGVQTKTGYITTSPEDLQLVRTLRPKR